MLDKRKIRILKKYNFNRFYFIFILFILLFFIGTAYSVLNQNLKIDGSIIIPKQEIAKLSATFIRNRWGLFETRYTLTIINNTEYSISNWEATINYNDITTATAENIDLIVDIVANKNILTITAPKGSNSGVIDANKSATYNVSVSSFLNFTSSCSATATTKIDPQYIEVSKKSLENTNSSNTFKSNYISKDISNKFLTNYKENKLKNFVIETEQIALAVEYDVSKLETTITNATIKVINPQNYNISNLSFDIIYNEKIDNYQKIRSNNLLQIDSLVQKSSYKLKDNDKIAPKSVKYYNINNFITKDDFKSFTFENIKCEFDKEIKKENNDNLQIIDKNKSDYIENDKNIIVNNILEENSNRIYEENITKENNNISNSIVQ